MKLDQLCSSSDPVVLENAILSVYLQTDFLERLPGDVHENPGGWGALPYF